MSFLVRSLKKLAGFFIYLLTLLGFFQLQQILFFPTLQNLEKLFFCIVLGAVVTYVNGFVLFKGPFIRNK